MKKLFSLIAILILSITVSSSAFAAAELPNASVWFEPSTAAVGESVTLNALVYNNQTVDATITVGFSTDAAKINSMTVLVPKQSAKTVSVGWKMPAKNTIVTASVTAAVNSSKKSIPALLGTLGIITVGPATATTTAVSSVPGGAKIISWIAPLLVKTEAFRLKEATHYATVRDAVRIRLGITTVKTPVSTQPQTPAPATEGINGTGSDGTNLASKALGNPTDWITLVFSTSCATLFASQALFYIAAVLVLLLVLRFIVNLIF